MVRIGGGVYPDIMESDYLSSEGVWGLSAHCNHVLM
jgi:hypothetical protein